MILRLLPFLLSICIAADVRGQAFQLADPGTEPIVQYEKYGRFEKLGEYGTAYVTTDEAGLAKASGEGIDPSKSVLNDPALKDYRAKKKIVGPVWNYVHSGDPQADFFAWALCHEDPGLRLLFTGKALEDAGLYTHALKAYYASMILYPKSFCWSRKRTYTWPTAPVAWGSIANLTRRHPEIEWKLVGTEMKARTHLGGDPAKNEVAYKPGRFIKDTRQDREKRRVPPAQLKVAERRGGKIACVRYANGQWGLEADGKPFFVRGVSYLPTKVGYHISGWHWMSADENNNGKCDTAYDAWVDRNSNNVQDTDEPASGDFKLLQEMGCNAIRIFANEPINTEVLRDLQKTYGIRVILCDPFGAYTVNSGASWEKGTDYTDAEQRKRMLEAVRKMAGQYKDEPWLLAYILGNENNMPPSFSGVNATRTNAGTHPESYATLLNEAAALIHKIDPNHPVGVGNQGTGLLDVYAKHAPELDFVGINEYPGSDGFGALWEAVKGSFDRPVLITEFGCDAYWTDKGPNEEAQTAYHRGNWEDVVYNRAGEPGAGNCIGAIVFEWLDEWWKDTSLQGQDGKHNSQPTIEMAFPDGWSQEEWLGIVGQGDGKLSPFLRQPRKAYYFYQDIWTKE